MKTLNEYICEELGNKTLRNLTIKYDCPDEVFIQTPEQMGESDVQIYIDDTLLSKFPAEANQDEFGKNTSHITDEYFEYDRIEETNGISQKADIEWDDHYDQSMNGTNMHVLKISGLKYVIVFDRFELENVDDDNVKETIYNFFNGLIDDKELPFTVTLNEDNIKWK